MAELEVIEHPGDCCSAAARSSCCEADAKQGCCGEADEPTCGCDEGRAIAPEDAGT